MNEQNKALKKGHKTHRNLKENCFHLVYKKVHNKSDTWEDVDRKYDICTCLTESLALFSLGTKEFWESMKYSNRSSGL